MSTDPRVSHDVYRPSALPSANLGRGTSQAQHTPLEQQLDQAEERWNVRIDRVVKAMATGLKEIIQLAETTPTDPPALSSLPLRTSALISTASSLRDLTHELKLMLLLSDQVGLAEGRDREVGMVKAEIEEKRKLVGKEVGYLLGGEGGEMGERCKGVVFDRGAGDGGGGKDGGDGEARGGGDAEKESEIEGGGEGLERRGEGEEAQGQEGIGEGATGVERDGGATNGGETEERPPRNESIQHGQEGGPEGEEDGMDFDEVSVGAEEEEL